MIDVGRLRPEVRDYRVQSFGLGAELSHLETVSASGVLEAVVFYANRIFETTTRASLFDLGLPPSQNAYRNLGELEALGQLESVDVYGGHAMRRLGNAARHASAPIDAHDADATVSFLAHWLAWFFVRRRGRASVSGLDGGETPWHAPDLSAGRLTLRLLDEVGRDGAVSEETASALLASDWSEGIAHRTALALAAESLIEAKRTQHARAFLVRAREVDAEDPRLLQLDALLRRRTGDGDGAIALLEPLIARQGDDEEAVGILAAAHKTRWESTGDTASLVRAHKLYRRGWGASRRRNAWLGTNAAATALFLGRQDDARSLAAEVRQDLEERERRLRESRGRDLSLPYYYEVSIAEARLLEGDEPGARRRFRRAFLRHPERKGSADVTRGQAARILAARGRPVAFDDWLEQDGDDARDGAEEGSTPWD